MSVVANNYTANDNFSKVIHKKIGREIYTKLGWNKVDIDLEESQNLELNQGINHIFEVDGKSTGVNERFRRSKYKNYNDFTVRYRNEYSKHLALNRSEFFKIKAKYLVYGVTNLDSELSSTSFLKYAVINLEVFFKLLDSNKIVINEKLKECQIINGVLNIVKKNNYGGSSFLAVDITMLKPYLKDNPDLIILSKNYSL